MKITHWLIASLVVVVLIGCGSGGTTGAGGGTGGGAAGGTGGTGGTGGGTAGGAGGGTGGSGGGAVDAGTPTPTALIDLSAGAEYSCAVLATKKAKCWGRNNEGQLGNGTTTDSVKPVEVMGLTNVVSISAGYEHTCAVLDDGTGRCWGRNSQGQLGNNTTVDSEVPVQVMGLTNLASIHSGVYISCALTTAGVVSCWGRGGDLGDGTVTQSIVPRPVPGLTNVTQLSIAPNSGTSSPIHVCGVRSTKTAFCWGSNSAGELGDGTQGSSRVPVNVKDVADAIEITAGGSHACARRTSGLFCWGFSQEVGDGTVNQRLVPTAVDTTQMVTSVEAGNGHTLARTTAGGLICWGRNGRGACGDSAMFTAGGPIYLSPRPATLTGVTLFSSGGTHSCGYVGAQMTTWCWGSSDYGELGYATPFGVSRVSVPDFVRW